jgi:RimJ/RimL family protein N-acetyltransferase
METKIIIKKVKSIIENNNKCLIKDIEIYGNKYCLRPFDNSEFSFQSVKNMYSDYYINSMVSSVVKISEGSFQKKLDYFVSLNEQYGFGLFNICTQDTNQSIGLYGLKLKPPVFDELELAYITKKDYINTLPFNKDKEFSIISKEKGIIRPLSKVIIEFAFETFKEITKIHIKEVLSYNKPSQLIAKLIGMVENDIIKCDDDYIKDSYLLNFVLTRKRYNKLKSLNNGKYELSNIPKNIQLKDLHNKARTLSQAIQKFKKKNIKRYIHCSKLYDYMKDYKQKKQTCNLQ